MTTNKGDGFMRLFLKKKTTYKGYVLRSCTIWEGGAEHFFTNAKFGSIMLWNLTKLKCKTVFIILPLLLKLCETWWNLVKLSETFSSNFPWKLHVISKTVKLPYYTPRTCPPLFFFSCWGGGLWLGGDRG